ncbi:MAG: hypothetical protein NTY19_50885 [Planctomycetota bacterium]|nr:hypothetical protein [Planctomycetota bacterium]
MSLRSDWEKAKQTSEKEFAEAYKDWLRQLNDQVQAGDPQARKKLLMEALAKSGLAEGPKFTNYCEFKLGLGPLLDRFEAAQKQYEVAVKKDGTLNKSIAAVVKDKAALAVLTAFCKKEYSSENLDFYLDAKKGLAADKLHAKYIATNKMNLGSDATSAWKAGEGDKWKKNGKVCIEKTLKYVEENLSDTLSRVMVSGEWKKACGFPDFETLTGKISEVVVAYGRQLGAYAKRWSKMKPPFWTPCLKQLDAIAKELNAWRKK